MATSNHQARFWIRYTVPTHNVPRAIDELLGLWRRKLIHGVLLFVCDIEERGQGLNTIEEVRTWVAEIQPLLDTLRENKIPWGFNIWQTIGFSRFAPGLRRPVPYQPMIGHDGTVAQEWACPLDQAFVKHLVDMYGLLTESNPQTIWIDDDFRYWGRNPAALTCFCPLHCEAMRKRTGHRYTRKSLVKAIGDPHREGGKIRRAWLTTQYESLATIVDKIHARVKKVNPRTKLCLMTGGMEHRAVDGWVWPDLVKRLSPDGPVRIRPGFGFYSGGDPRPYLWGTVYPRHQQALLPRNAELWPEVENYPGGVFSRSTRSMLTQMFIAAFFGMGKNITLSVTGMMSNSIADSLPIIEGFNDAQPLFAAINEAVEAFPQEEGLRLLFNGSVGRYLDWRSDVPWHWPLQRPWDYVLPPMGFPVTFRPAGDVVSVGSGGSLAEALSKAELADLLRQGLFVDGPFAARMGEMFPGLAIHPRVLEPKGGAAFEEISDGSFGGAGNCVSLRQTPRLWRIDPGKNGRVISWCMDHNGRRIMPGVVLFDAGKAGRLAVTAIDAQSLTDQWTYFRAGARKRQLEAVMSWLGRVPMLVRDLPDVFPLVRKGRSGRLIAIANLRDDPWAKVELNLDGGKTPRRVQMLDMKGNWRPVRFNADQVGGKLRLTLPGVPITVPMAMWKVE